MKSKIITISGSSAVGKSFYVNKIISKFPDITEIIGLTSRPKREGEIDGKSGHFITIQEMEQLEKSGELMLVKEFFGNKYAWYKKDLINAQGLKIMNISYKSVEELKKNGLDIFSIFIRPESEEKLVERLKLRTKSKAEYEKRLKDYYESERFISESKQEFDLVFTNCYDEKSLEKLLNYIENTFIHNDKNSQDDRIEEEISNLLSKDKELEYKIQLANELLACKQKNKEEEEYVR